MAERKQVNIRLDDELEAKFTRLEKLVSESIGLKVTRTDIVRLAIAELEKKFAAPVPRNRESKK